MAVPGDLSAARDVPEIGGFSAQPRLPTGRGRRRGRLGGREQRGVPYLAPPCLQGAAATRTTLPSELSLIFSILKFN